MSRTYACNEYASKCGLPLSWVGKTSASGLVPVMVSNQEWQKCCNCMFKCVARGTTNLVEACGYLAVGTLYGGYREAWAFWAVQILFSAGTCVFSIYRMMLSDDVVPFAIHGASSRGHQHHGGWLPAEQVRSSSTGQRAKQRTPQSAGTSAFRCGINCCFRPFVVCHCSSNLLRNAGPISHTNLLRHAHCGQHVLRSPAACSAPCTDRSARSWPSLTWRGSGRSSPEGKAMSAYVDSPVKKGHTFLQRGPANTTGKMVKGQTGGRALCFMDPVGVEREEACSDSRARSPFRHAASGLSFLKPWPLRSGGWATMSSCSPPRMGMMRKRRRRKTAACTHALRE